jgi:hypothetical protein
MILVARLLVSPNAGTGLAMANAENIDEPRQPAVAVSISLVLPACIAFMWRSGVRA